MIYAGEALEVEAIDVALCEYPRWTHGAARRDIAGEVIGVESVRVPIEVGAYADTSRRKQGRARRNVIGEAVGCVRGG